MKQPLGAEQTKQAACYHNRRSFSVELQLSCGAQAGEKTEHRSAATAYAPGFEADTDRKRQVRSQADLKICQGPYNALGKYWGAVQRELPVNVEAASQALGVVIERWMPDGIS